MAAFSFYLFFFSSAFKSYIKRENKNDFSQNNSIHDVFIYVYCVLTAPTSLFLILLLLLFFVR